MESRTPWPAPPPARITLVPNARYDCSRTPPRRRPDREERMAVRNFDEDTHYETRALQIYQILIGLAANRQTITYGLLSDKMGGYAGGRGGILAHPLGCIMRWCQTNELPALTTLVVDSQTGLPSVGLTTVENNQFPAECERVFRFGWFAIFPPALDELRALKPTT